ncbi:MAG: substrate-binding periplasmic protein [Leptolyngbya sp. IPPAS B-1204]|nr:amino acid ABC transporter substrate-binding protein [Elainella sp. C42_A2020_010]RNJ70095.1 MAG: amino acid ABC transporter substrate-binding protein [Leptolyngbya sp. IPPAS B-1204]
MDLLSPPLKTVIPGTLNIVASDFDARPMSYVVDGLHLGYEPDVARAVCQRLGLNPVWHNLPMAKFYPSLQTGKYDLVWFNQAITPERQAWANFTRPYGYFDEAVLVRVESTASSPAELAGLRVGGLADSTNLALAARFADAQIVPFPGSDNVLPEMLQALRTGEIDALVDDELVLLVAAEEDPRLKIAFSVPTQVPFGIAVCPGQPELVDALNATLSDLIADGTLLQLWSHWIPWKPFPLR